MKSDDKTIKQLHEHLSNGLPRSVDSDKIEINSTQ